MIEIIVLSLVLLGALGLGYRIGHWWAVALVLLVPLAFPLYEPDSDGAPRWFYPTLFLGPPVMFALALGVMMRKLSRKKRPRRHRTSHD